MARDHFLCVEVIQHEPDLFGRDAAHERELDCRGRPSAAQGYIDIGRPESAAGRNGRNGRYNCWKQYS